MNVFWMVWNGTSKRLYRKHRTIKGARDRAALLASRNSQCKFYVVKVVEEVRMQHCLVGGKTLEDSDNG